MKTVLDLIGEFAELNDAKVAYRGRLPLESEKRWEELKAFYDLLMSRTGVGPRPVTRRFSATDVIEKVKARERLRVPLETEIVFEIGNEFHAGYAVNLSRGGMFLSHNEVLPVKSNLKIYLASPDAVDEALVEAPGEVAWVTEQGIVEASLPRGMGVRFGRSIAYVQRHLDAMVVDCLVRHLSGLDATGLAPEFLIDEAIEL